MAKKKSVNRKEMNMDARCYSRYNNTACHTGSLYGLGFIGAVVYYIQTATGFWAGVVGVLKAIVWPAFLVHKLLGI
ncbi:MAG: hypothetical protein ABH864_06465 [archaeon]